MPSGGKPAIATTPTPDPSQLPDGSRQAPDPGDPLRALDLRNMADGVEDRRLGQAVHHHVQQPGKIGERAAHSERETMMPMCSIEE
jgi:hypothetical protein